MKRILCFLLIFILTVVPVTAYAEGGNNGGWLELLEITSVQSDGDNWFNMPGKTGALSIPIPTEMRLCKIDLLITNASNDPITAVMVTKGTTTQSLSFVRVDSTTTRIYGNIPSGYYKSIDLSITKSTTSVSALQVLSCKVTSLATIDSRASGTLRRFYSDPSPLTLPANFMVDGTGDFNTYEYKLIPVVITDWRKFDYITLYGSISTMALNSFRASIGTKGLPYQISYMESIPTGTDSENSFFYEYNSFTETDYYTAPENPDEGSSEEGFANGDSVNTETIVYGGAVLFTVTIDLTGVDRSVADNLECYFTCIATPGLGYAFNVQDASGSVLTADTTNVSWWTRFTTFMSDLFGGDTSEADQFASEMEQTNQELADANEQIDSVTKPNVEEVPIDPSQFLDPQGMEVTGQIFSQLLGNELVMPMASITLICGLAAFIIF